MASDGGATPALRGGVASDTPRRRLAALLGLCLLGLLPAASAYAQEEPDPQHTRVAFAAGLGGIVPLAGYADRQLGIGVEGSVAALFDRTLWLAGVGVRHAVTNRDDTFTHVPLEASLLYLISDAGSTPLIGGGVGLHYLFEEVHVRSTVGEVLRSTSTDIIEDDLFGAGLFARAGVLFARNSTISWMVSADYAITIAEFQERSSEHAVRITFGALLGGQ